ncbi:hypothetical protein EPO44_04590 [bacterium]|nr:MAG: hypothetical protein EPO44_04590 [bacterium]
MNFRRKHTIETPAKSKETHSGKQDPRIYWLLFLCLIAALPAVVLSYLQGKRWETAVKERADRQAMLVAREIAAEIGRQVEDNARVMEALAKLVEIRGTLDPDVLQKMVTAQRAPFIPFSSLMYIANAKGTAVAYDPPFDKFGTPNVGTDYSDRDYYKELVRTEGAGPAIIGPVRMGRRSHAPNVQTAAAAHDLPGRFWAFTQGSIDLTTLQPEVEQIVAGTPDLKVVVTSKDGKVFIHPEKNALEEMRDLSNYPLFQPPQNPNGEFRSGVDEPGVAVRAAVLSILQRGIHWRVVVYRPEALTAAEVGPIHRQIWGILVASLLAAYIPVALVWKAKRAKEGK